MRRIAKRLIASATPKNIPNSATAVFWVTDALRPHLANLVGKGGVRALLARALVLAAAEVPWLGAATIGGDGDLEGLDALSVPLDSAEFLEGRVVLLAQLFGLLVAFIGPSLTSRLMGEIWPKVPFKDRDFGKEHDGEEAK